MRFTAIITALVIVSVSAKLESDDPIHYLNETEPRLLSQCDNGDVELFGWNGVWQSNINGFYTRRPFTFNGFPVYRKAQAPLHWLYTDNDRWVIAPSLAASANEIVAREAATAFPHPTPVSTGAWQVVQVVPGPLNILHPAPGLDWRICRPCEPHDDPLWQFHGNCCTAERPCPLGEGDCETNDQCEGNLVCGNNNCQALHPGVGFPPWADCCQLGIVIFPPVFQAATEN